MGWVCFLLASGAIVWLTVCAHVLRPKAHPCTANSHHRRRGAGARVRLRCRGGAIAAYACASHRIVLARSCDRTHGLQRMVHVECCILSQPVWACSRACCARIFARFGVSFMQLVRAALSPALSFFCIKITEIKMVGAVVAHRAIALRHGEHSASANSNSLGAAEERSCQICSYRIQGGSMLRAHHRCIRPRWLYCTPLSAGSIRRAIAILRIPF